MIARCSVVLSILAAFALLTANTVEAADPPATTINVQGMHCAGCASKVVGKLQAIAGVNKAQVDAAKSVAVVTTKVDATVSPRALWEAVEKAGFKPTKIVGPSGTFTSKPKS